MTMTELPVKEKITVQQKRAAQRATGNTQGATTSSKAYILTSTLPPELRISDILPPPKIPSVAAEGGYTGFYTFVVSIIYLSQGSRISEAKLDRHLARANAGEFVFGEKTDKILKRMEKDGYIVKIREREVGGEETVEWVVGPRGKVEIGENGVAQMVKGVYGKIDVDMDELEDKLEKSLGEGTFKRVVKRRNSEEPEEAREVDETTQEESNPPRRRSARRSESRTGTSRRISTRVPRRREEDDGEEEEEDEEDDDDGGELEDENNDGEEEDEDDD